jgi:hypothetical protein
MFYKLPLAEKKTYLKDIAISMSLFFDRNNKRYNDFKNRKLLEIQIQDLILRIISVLTREKDCCYVLLDCDFFDELINYLNIFSSTRNDNVSTSKSQSDSKSLKSIKNQGFIPYVIDKKKRKMNPESIKKYLTGIIFNILNIIYNISNQEGEDIYDKFSGVVNIYFYFLLFSFILFYFISLFNIISFNLILFLRLGTILMVWIL